MKLLIEISHPNRDGQSILLHPLLRIVLENAISTFDSDRYRHYLMRIFIFQHYRSLELPPKVANAGPIEEFYNWAAAYSEDAASRLL